MVDFVRVPVAPAPAPVAVSAPPPMPPVINGNGHHKPAAPPPPPVEPIEVVAEPKVEAKPPRILPPEEMTLAPAQSEPEPLAPAPPVPVKPPAEAMTFEVLLQSMDQPAGPTAAPMPASPSPQPKTFFSMDPPPTQEAAVVNLSSTPVASPAPAPELEVVMPPPLMVPTETPVPSVEEDDNALGHKDIGAVFFYPEGANEALETVYRKFLEVIKKHKLKFRLKRAHSEPYAYKGKINYSSFVDICKQNKVPVAIVIGPPADGGGPHQDFYDLLTVTLDVQGVSLQLVNWSEINKDYRYLNLALDIALVRSR